MQVQSKRLQCCHCPSLCTENLNNEHPSNFGLLQGSTTSLGKLLQCLTSSMGNFLFLLSNWHFPSCHQSLCHPLSFAGHQGKGLDFVPLLPAKLCLPSLGHSPTAPYHPYILSVGS